MGANDVSVTLLIWGLKLPVSQAVTGLSNWVTDAESGDRGLPLLG